MRHRAKRYVAKLAGRADEALEVEPLGGGRFAVTLRGARHELDALTLDHGAVSLLVDGDSYTAEFEEQCDEVAVLLRNHVVRVDIADERRLRLRAAQVGFHVEGRQVVAAPMPGKIVRVLVKHGEAVCEGQGLIVIEAMKMENELTSPKAGRVVELLATEGTSVENNARLAVIE